MREHRRIIITIMEGNVLVTNVSLYIFQLVCIRRVRDLRLRFHHIQETAESRHTFLHGLDQLHQNLDRINEDTDI